MNRCIYIFGKQKDGSVQRTSPISGWKVTNTSQATSSFFFQTADQSDYFKNNLIRIWCIFYTCGFQLGVIWQRLEMFLVDVIEGVCVYVCVYMCVTSFSWMAARGAGKHPVRHRTAPMTKNYPIQSVRTIQRQKPCSRESPIICWNWSFCSDIIHPSAAKEGYTGIYVCLLGLQTPSSKTFPSHFLVLLQLSGGQEVRARTRRLEARFGL